MAHPGLPLLIRFLPKVLLGCSLRELANRSGIHENLLSRYGTGAVQPTARNLARILSAAGVLEIRQPLLLAFDQLATLLSPPPTQDALPNLRDFLQRTSRRLLQLQPDAELSSGEYSSPDRRGLVATALLVRFLRTILLDCNQRELSRRTGIDRRVLVRYETGESRRLNAENLDRLLAEAGVLHLKGPLLQAMSHLSALLASPSRPAKVFDLPAAEVEAFLAFSAELLHRTSEKLYPNAVPRHRDVFLDEE
jgi:transcriptional regulator with XRE-family HTH domain